MPLTTCGEAWEDLSRYEIPFIELLPHTSLRRVLVMDESMSRFVSSDSSTSNNNQIDHHFMAGYDGDSGTTSTLKNVPKAVLTHGPTWALPMGSRFMGAQSAHGSL